MKRMVWLAAALLLLLAACRAPSPAVEAAPQPWPSAPVTLYASSDLHWQSRSATPRTEGLEELLETLLDQAERDGPKALVLCGDLTNNGRLEEHQAVAARLEEARQSGVAVFVTMGNHDLDQKLPPETLTELYGAFGWEQAVSTDDDSMSYLAQVTDTLWLLSLDCNTYGEKGTGVAGTISEETLAWVEDCLKRAEAAGALVVPFSHHNLIVHNLSNDPSSYNIDGGDRLRELLLSYGVPIYLSGHRHNSFLAEGSSGEGRLVEAVVATPMAFPHYYTALTFQPEGTVRHQLRRLDVDGWARQTGREEPELLDFTARSEARARERLEENARQMAERIGTSEREREELKRYYLDFCTNYQNHRLWQEGERLRQDPALELWRAHSEENVYARWMPWVLEHQDNDAPEQVLGPFR